MASWLYEIYVSNFLKNIRLIRFLMVPLNACKYNKFQADTFIFDMHKAF